MEGVRAMGVNVEKLFERRRRKKAWIYGWIEARKQLRGKRIETQREMQIKGKMWKREESEERVRERWMDGWIGGWS